MLLWATPATAQVYVALNRGLTVSADPSVGLVGNSQPTWCDTLLYPPYTTVNIADCPTAAREIYSTDFPLDGGGESAVRAGFNWRGVTFEGEYIHFGHGIGQAAILPSDAVTVEKGREWSVLSPPVARMSDVQSHYVMLNVYRLLRPDSWWSPYVGSGVGYGHTSFHYSSRFVRRTLNQGYFPVRGVDPFTGEVVPAWQAAAAGTVSTVDDTIGLSHVSLQAIGGMEFQLSERVSFDIRGRWIGPIGELEADTTWELLRSHEPVLADGVTPYGLGLAVDGLEHIGVSFGIKVGF